MSNWFFLQLWMGLCAGAIGAMIALGITRIFSLRRRTPTTQARMHQRMIPIIVACLVSVLVIHITLDAEIDGWEYSAVADDAKKDPVVQTDLKEALADGVVTAREYHAITDARAQRLHEKLFRDGREAARAQAR